MYLFMNCTVIDVEPSARYCIYLASQLRGVCSLDECLALPWWLQVCHVITDHVLQKCVGSNTVPFLRRSPEDAPYGAKLERSEVVSSSNTSVLRIGIQVQRKE